MDNKFIGNEHVCDDMIKPKVTGAFMKLDKWQTTQTFLQKNTDTYYRKNECRLDINCEDE